MGDADQFLGLTPEESAMLDVRMALSSALKQRREAANLAQATLANRMKSSQSRVAKMEACDPTVSVDLLVRAIFATGATREDVGQVISKGLTYQKAVCSQQIKQPRRGRAGENNSV